MSRRLIVSDGSDVLCVVEMAASVIDAWCDGYAAGAASIADWQVISAIDPDDLAQVEKALRELAVTGEARERLRLLAYGLRQRP